MTSACERQVKFLVARKRANGDLGARPLHPYIAPCAQVERLALVRLDQINAAFDRLRSGETIRQIVDFS
jgi:hypothetical protein